MRGVIVGDSQATGGAYEKKRGDRRQDTHDTMMTRKCRFFFFFLSQRDVTFEVNIVLNCTTKVFLHLYLEVQRAI